MKKTGVCMKMWEYEFRSDGLSVPVRHNFPCICTRYNSSKQIIHEVKLDREEASYVLRRWRKLGFDRQYRKEHP